MYVSCGILGFSGGPQNSCAVRVKKSTPVRQFEESQVQYVDRGCGILKMPPRVRRFFVE